MYKKYLLASLLSITSFSFADSGKLSTLDITQSAVECTDCMDWKLLGICYWLKCSFFDCEIRESTRVGHYMPDLVVSSYSAKTEWDEMRGVNPIPVAVIHQTESYRDQATPLNFKNVDIFAHPALTVFNGFSESSDLFCESMLKVPLVPIFLSGLDPAWNDPAVERLYPQSAIGLPKFKTGITLPLLGDGYWAPLYPRCGWGAHPYDAVNAAVAAHRASEIVTRTTQPHVYTSAQGKCKSKCWAPDPVDVNEHHDNRFQMLAPNMEMNTKSFEGPVTWANGKTTLRESYTWTLWRYYTCCIKKGQTYLGKTDF